MGDWLREFVERHMAAQISEDPSVVPLLKEAGGMLLYGTIGATVFLRPDGSTVALVEGDAREPPRW